MKQNHNLYKVFVFSLLAIYLMLIVYTAWVSDDGFITFRTIENWTHGYGLVFNVGERVQTFTHPLWLLLQSCVYLLLRLLSYSFGLNRLFLGNIIISLSISLVTVVLFSFRIARSTQMAILGLLILTLSKSFIDYSTSGLENPLSHFLAVCFFALFLLKGERDQRRIFVLSMFSGLAVLNRLDTSLLFFPALTYILLKSSNKPKTIFSVFMGLLPVVIWELFSIFYYGTFFPNTAIAKLNTGIHKVDLFEQGAYYFLNSLHIDTITLVVISFSILLAFYSKRRHCIVTAIGISLYLIYILYIGGDFMSGRYFSLPLIVAVVLISTFDIRTNIIFVGSLILVLMVGLLPFVTTIKRRPTFGDNRENNLVFIDKHKVADERLIYAERTGLITAIQGNSPRIVYSQEDWFYLPGFPREVHLVGAMGINGLRDGPNIHVIDKNGLADPLIARMPLTDTQRWRIGHFHHFIPTGYVDTLASGTNLIQDTDVALFYDKLSLVIKGPVRDRDRLVEIWNLNTGEYDRLLKNINPNSMSP